MDEKKEIINRINETTKEINDIWDKLKQYDINSIKSAWNDPICDDYIKKFKKVDGTIQTINNQLNNLRSYWEKYDEKLMIETEV